MNPADVKAFFDRVASDGHTMRIAYYDERVIERLGDFADLTPDMVVRQRRSARGRHHRTAAGRRLRRRRVRQHGPASRGGSRRDAHRDGVRRPARRRGRDLRRGGAPWAWMREEHADIWLGFIPEQVHSFFAAAGLESPSLERLGRQ
jgi:hypothetical protein